MTELKNEYNNNNGIDKPIPEEATTSSTTSEQSNKEYNSNNIVFGSKYKHNLRSAISIDKTPSKYNEIIDLFLSPDLELVSSLCSTTLVKETVPNNVHISEYLIIFFEYHCNLKSSYILKWAIDKEIDNTTNSATLFRGLSTATRLISAFYKRVGESYLKYLLQPFVLDLCSRNFSFEIDPEKAGKGVNIQENLSKLITITQQLLDKILDSVDQCPIPIRQILNHTQEKVEKKFESMKTTVVGGFIFLRFICPAIVAPEAFGLIPKEEEPTPETRRSLVLVSKLLQNLANEMPFGNGIKEEYMSYLNDFIVTNSERIHIFFDNLAEPVISSSNTSTKNSPPIKSSTSMNNLSSLNITNNCNGTITSTEQSSGSVLNHNDENNNNNNINNNINLIINNKSSEESVNDNLNVLINQVIEHREKIENFISTECKDGQEIVKRLDGALQSVKQKAFFKSMLPWIRGKDGSSPSNKLKKSPSANNVVSNSQHILQLQQQVLIEKEKMNNNKIKESPISLTQSQHVETNGGKGLLMKNHQYSQSHQNLEEFGECQMKDQKEVDIINLMAENSRLKKENDDLKSRNNILNKLRGELDREKAEKRELKAIIKKCNERLKQLDQVDLISELSPYVDDPIHPAADLQTLIEETLGVGNSGVNPKKKSNSSLGISKIKSTLDSSNSSLIAPNSAHSLSSSSTTISNYPSSVATTPIVINDQSSSLQPSPQPLPQPTSSVNLNQSTFNIPHLDVSGDSSNNCSTSNLYQLKKSSTNASMSEASSIMTEISENDEPKTGSNISISSKTIGSNTTGGSGTISTTNNAAATTTGATTVNQSRRNSTTSEISVISEAIDTYEHQNRIIQAVVEGSELLDDSSCDLLEFLKEVANNKEQELQKQKLKQQEEKEKRASVFFKFSSKFGKKKKHNTLTSSNISTTSPTMQSIRENVPSSAMMSL